MRPDVSQFLPYLIAALLVYAVYRRLCRSFGPQPLQSGRMTVRILLLSAAVCALLPLALRSTQFLTAELVGALLGISLGAWGAKRTRFLMSGGRTQYVPHTYTGIAVSLLFLGRLAFRAVQVYAGAQAPPGNAAAADPSQAFAAASMVGSPLTVGLVFLLAGYYLWYYGWVLWKSKHLEPADIEAAPAAR